MAETVPAAVTVAASVTASVAASVAVTVPVAVAASCLCVFAVRSCDGVMSDPGASEPRPRLLEKLQLLRSRLPLKDGVAVRKTAETINDLQVADGKVKIEIE